jgi:hypothetical protein
MTPTTQAAVPGTARTVTETHGWWSRRPWLHMFLRGRWRRATTPDRPHLPAPVPLVTAGRGQG